MNFYSVNYLKSFFKFLLPCWIGTALDNTCLWLGVESVQRVYTKQWHRSTWFTEYVEGVHFFARKMSLFHGSINIRIKKAVIFWGELSNQRMDWPKNVLIMCISVTSLANSCICEAEDWEWGDTLIKSKFCYNFR